MLTPDQEKWINHLSGESKIKIVSYDQTAPEKFEKAKKRIQTKLGKSIQIEHHGATSLRISGQDEIDIYIPIDPTDFDSFISLLKEIFGEPKSYYLLERARFVTVEDEKHIDVFLINRESLNWLNMLRFEQYLKTHLEILKKYEQLKEAGDGLSVREYYRKKIEFINDVLGRVTI